MKKNLIVKICFLVSIAAFGAAALAQSHTFHRWEKLTEEDGVNGQKVCVWACRPGRGFGAEHHTITSGRRRCPRPD